MDEEIASVRHEPLYSNGAEESEDLVLCTDEVADGAVGLLLPIED
ncbi:hypothetical protein LCGC14_2471420, partial [marine sediment metagenome]